MCVCEQASVGHGVTILDSPYSPAPCADLAYSGAARADHPQKLIVVEDPYVLAGTLVELLLHALREKVAAVHVGGHSAHRAVLMLLEHDVPHEAAVHLLVLGHWHLELLLRSL